MIGFKKRDTKDLLKTVARAHGISVAEVKAEMQATIDEARNNPDPENRRSSENILEIGHLLPKNLFM